MPQTTIVKPVTTKERPLITIEFAPNIHPSETEYSYEHPQFTFGDRVIITDHFPELEFTVCALELIESKTASGQLLSQPRWKYKISNGEVSYQKEESALARPQSASSEDRTCSSCTHFQDYREPKFFQVDGQSIPNNNEGRGWCHNFDRPAKSHHIRTDDCIRGRKALKESVDITSTEVIELDREGYPMEFAEPTGYYSTAEFVTNPNEPF